MYSSFLFHSYQCNLNYTERLKKCIWATFENHWDLLLRECAKRKEKEKKYTNKTLFKSILSANKTLVTE